MVKLKSGKMSSRKGTVIMFNQLKELLSRHIFDNYLRAYTLPEAKEKWTPEEVARAQHLTSVATIKYGMLKQDSATVSPCTLFSACSFFGLCVFSRICRPIRHLDTFQFGLLKSDHLCSCVFVAARISFLS